MSDNKFKRLPYGTEEFSVLRKEDYYYIDKSLYIKNVFENSASVILFTRPRRFGKTLLMDMFATYLTIFYFSDVSLLSQRSLIQNSQNI